MNKNILTEQQHERLERAFAKVNYARLLGIKIESLELGKATVSFEARDELKQNIGVIHGGAIASLVDTATALALIPLLEDAQSSTTIDLTIHYLRPLTEGKVTATANVIKAGRRIITLSAEVYDKDGKLAATALSNYLRLAKVI